MKKINSLLLGAVMGLSSLNVYSQVPTLPAASPAASVSQVFGITKIEIDYSCPGVRKGGVGPERQIWGDVVPYDSVWRSGANQATTISFSTDVNVGGQAVKKGKYALFTIPGRNSWTIILNSDADQWGAYDYKKSLDVARFTVSAQPAEMKERLSYTIDPVSDSLGRVTLSWEKLKVSFDVTADTKGMAKKSIDGSADNAWRTLASSANYYVDNNLDLKKAHDWAQASLNLKKDNYYNQYVMAKVLHAEGNNQEALKYANEAKAIGDNKGTDPSYQNSKDRVEKLIADLGGAKK